MAYTRTESGAGKNYILRFLIDLTSKIFQSGDCSCFVFLNSTVASKTSFNMLNRFSIECRK